jgi:hypothetical protein
VLFLELLAVLEEQRLVALDELGRPQDPELGALLDLELRRRDVLHRHLGAQPAPAQEGSPGERARANRQRVATREQSHASAP